MSRFDNIKYDQDAATLQANFKEMFTGLEHVMEKNLQSPRAKALALTKLEECYMWVGKAVRDDQIKRDGEVKLQEDRDPAADAKTLKHLKPCICEGKQGYGFQLEEWKVSEMAIRAFCDVVARHTNVTVHYFRDAMERNFCMFFDTTDMENLLKIQELLGHEEMI